ncbi:MAG: GTP pyrophosphokinase family protein [Lachnospiraceae bacterium]|nr:GTP pyrophosphokinase family protein [Lachnospiraceae bacterium]
MDSRLLVGATVNDQMDEESMSKLFAHEGIQRFQEIMMMYRCAIKEVQTKLENLNDEMSTKRQRNPINSIKSRIKTPRSIYEKINRKGMDMNMDTLLNDMHDIAGIRVVCSFIDDIYAIANMLTLQDDITLIKMKDYIKTPKENGYRSLHLVVEVPVFLSDRKQIMKVEVQIRTIAMDFWASLEHQIHYKKMDNAPITIIDDLKKCADNIYETDIEMQSIRKRLLGN